MSEPSSSDIRKDLLWNAMKARKANAIDAKALDVIRKLCQETPSAASNEKVTRFADQFITSLASKGLNVSSGSIKQRETELARDVNDANLKLPSSVLMHIVSFASIADAISFACTCYTINSGLYPINDWPNQIRTRLLALTRSAASTNQHNQHQGMLIQEVNAPPVESLISRPTAQSDRTDSVAEHVMSLLKKDENLFKPPSDYDGSNPRHHRSMTLTFFGRGSRLITINDYSELVNALMMRHILPRLQAQIYYLKLTVLIESPSRGMVASGDPLVLASCIPYEGFSHLKLTFAVPTSAEAPPIVKAGDTRFILHALQGDGRTISPVLTCQAINTMHESSYRLVRTGDGTHLTRGRVHVTVAGTRSTKYLGWLLHGDEGAFSSEVRSNAQGGHGMAGMDMRGSVEIVTMQTPRTVYKAPQGYSEVSPRKGVEIIVWTSTLYAHCCMPPV